MRLSNLVRLVVCSLVCCKVEGENDMVDVCNGGDGHREAREAMGLEYVTNKEMSRTRPKCM